MLKLVQESKWIRGDYIPIASISRPITEVLDRIGFTHFIGEEDGLGTSHYQLFQIAETNEQFYLMELIDSPNKNCTEIYGLSQEDVIKSNLNSILKEIELNKSNLWWIHPNLKNAP